MTVITQAPEPWLGVDAASAAAHRLRETIAGELHVPGDPDYDEQRRALRPTVDARPAIIVEAAGPDDVQAAVALAGEHELPLAVQATGHGTHVGADGGILLKTARMSSVLVDPDRRIARVGPGARWRDVLAAAAPFGLAPLCGSSGDVGVVGYTLGGGMGWLARRHGLAADSVVRAKVVTGRGTRVTASAARHAELFWALRGGGGSFGVVTSLEFRLYPVGRVYGGVSYFPIERAAEILAVYRDWIETVPDAMSSAVVLGEAPGGGRALARQVADAGEARAAERVLRPLRAAAGPALADGFRITPFAELEMGGTAPVQMDFADELSDALVHQLVETGRRATVEIRHWGGAITRPEAGAGPAAHRTAPLSVIVDAPAPAIREHTTGRTFLNFLGDTSRTRSAYAADAYARLRDVKRAYDPGNVLRVGHRIG